MFNVSGGEVIIILVLALVVLGPEKLPEVLRKAGKVYGDLRRMTTGFQEEFEETFKEPLREFRETANQARDMVNNPLAGFKEDEVIETSETVSSEADAQALPVASGSEPPYAPIVTADPPADEPDAAFMPPPAADAVLPPPASAVPSPPASAPLPPPAAPLWTPPIGQQRLDPWAVEKAAD
jgi:sec-independent protein translocase protein TatB